VLALCPSGGAAWTWVASAKGPPHPFIVTREESFWSSLLADAGRVKQPNRSINFYIEIRVNISVIMSFVKAEDRTQGCSW